MMFHKKFKMIFVTLGPIHIGSGQSYSTKEYFNESDHFYFPDMGQVYQFLTSKGYQKQFEEFLMTDDNRGWRLETFFNQRSIKERDFGGYSVKKTSFENKKTGARLNKLNVVSKFIRDGAGRPYIPGSSLKGAIRTILFNAAPEWKDTQLAEEYHTKSGNRVRERKIVKWGSSRGVEYDDIFNEIRVSDSKPIDISKFIITQKVDYSPHNNKVNGINLYRESIQPKVKIEFEIVVTSQRAYQLISQLETFAKDTYHLYHENYLSDLKATDGNLYIQPSFSFAPLYLGSGTGFWYKTKMNESLPYIQRQHGRKGSKKTVMIGKGAFKLTRAKVDSVQFKSGAKPLILNRDNLYEMGKGGFQLMEVE